MRVRLAAQELRQILFILGAALVFMGISERSSFARSPNLNPAITQKCYRAINRASQNSGVPKEVMLAISLTETGKKIGGKIHSWPWTVNMEGAGVWFENKSEALAYVNAHFARGARSFDVGCFQINYKWHHQHFRSIEDMFDPDINATYAAQFLAELYYETGSWAKAAGFYHSRTPEYAERYAKRFAGHLARMAGDPNAEVYDGHGSEALKVAQLEPDKPRPTPAWPFSNLGQRASTEFLSANPTGSLVQLEGATGLLTPTTRPMF